MIRSNWDIAEASIPRPSDARAAPTLPRFRPSVGTLMGLPILLAPACAYLYFAARRGGGLFDSFIPEVLLVCGTILAATFALMLKAFRPHRPEGRDGEGRDRLEHQED